MFNDSIMSLDRFQSWTTIQNKSREKYIIWKIWMKKIVNFCKIYLT